MVTNDYMRKRQWWWLSLVVVVVVCNASGRWRHRHVCNNTKRRWQGAAAALTTSMICCKESPNLTSSESSSWGTGREYLLYFSKMSMMSRSSCGPPRSSEGETEFNNNKRRHYTTKPVTLQFINCFKCVSHFYLQKKLKVVIRQKYMKDDNDFFFWKLKKDVYNMVLKKCPITWKTPHKRTEYEF